MGSRWAHTASAFRPELLARFHAGWAGSPFTGSSSPSINRPTNHFQGLKKKTGCGPASTFSFLFSPRGRLRTQPIPVTQQCIRPQQQSRGCQRLAASTREDCEDKLAAYTSTMRFPLGFGGGGGVANVVLKMLQLTDNCDTGRSVSTA